MRNRRSKKGKRGKPKKIVQQSPSIVQTHVSWGVVADRARLEEFHSALQHVDTKHQLDACYVPDDFPFSLEFASKTNITHVFDDFQNLLTCDVISTIYISINGPSVYGSCHRALSAGKHVVCTTLSYIPTTAQLRSLIKLATDRNVLFMDANRINFNNLANEFRNVLENEEIGQILTAYASLGSVEHRNNLIGGALRDFGHETIRFSLQTFGDVDPVRIDVSGTLMPSGIEAAANLKLIFESNGTATATATSMNQKICDAFVVGAHGFMKISPPFSNPSKIEIFGSKGVSLRSHISKSDRSWLVNMMVHVEDCLARGMVESDICTHEKSVRMLRVIESAVHELRK